jgi:hypothetical protein
MHALHRIMTAIALMACLSAIARAGEPRWKKHDINPKSIYECAGVADFDGDGKLDIASGDTWYRGPAFTEKVRIREFSRTGTYMNCFSNLPMDVNGDGMTDLVVCSYFERNVGWVQNPGEPGKEWTYYEVDLPGQSEAAVLVDLNGDGVPDVLPNTVTTVVWYSLEKATTKPHLKRHDFGSVGVRAKGHGVGSGDVNGDGRIDLLTPSGWFEGPEKGADVSWTWHPELNLGATGIQILARDVDGDGLSEVVYGMGHARGLFWIKQGKDPNGQRTWSKPMEIDPTLTSVHTLLWADIDGDGKAHELVTGKRVYAHEVEEGDIEASQVAWYDFDASAKSWRKHPIFVGEPAKDAPPRDQAAKRDAQKDFPAGTAGTGLEVTAVDIDGDGDVDLVCPGKSGLYLFENLGAK